MGLGRLDGNGSSLGHFETKTHHRLVNAADLLHVERAVAQALAVEDEQVAEHPEDNAVGDLRYIGLLSEVTGRLPRSAFEEVVAVGVEEVAVAGRDVELAVPSPFVDEPEERQELCPGAVALVHRVRIVGRLARSHESSAHYPSDGRWALGKSAF